MDDKTQKRLLGIDDKNITQEEKNIDEGLRYVNSKLTETINNKEYVNRPLNKFRGLHKQAID